MAWPVAPHATSAIIAINMFFIASLFATEDSFARIICSQVCHVLIAQAGRYRFHGRVLAVPCLVSLQRADDITCILTAEFWHVIGFRIRGAKPGYAVAT